MPNMKRVFVSNISVSGLRDTGHFYDAQDPAVRIAINGQIRETDR